jgi:hypothetical protein
LVTRQERKLTARAGMAITNSDEKTVDPKYQNWSHRAITFNKADQWAKILEPGHFPLVLDPVIKNVQFEKVLIDGGSALDLLFRNALTELGLKPEDLKPYYAPFWGCSQGRPLIPWVRSRCRSSLALPTTSTSTTSTLSSWILRKRTTPSSVDQP